VTAVDTFGGTARVLVEPRALPGAVWTAEVGEMDLPRAGDHVNLGIMTDHVLVFDVETAGSPLVSNRASGLAR